MSNNTIHQLTFNVKQHVFSNPEEEVAAFYFGDEEDFFSNDLVF